jgi:Na+-translocating ferredoxin:NAD+ oxidoreductase RnfC subunit
MLNDYFELGEIAAADSAGALSCIGCGVCSYICPARLPLSERVRRLKSAIGEHRTALPLFGRHRTNVPTEEAGR